MNDTEKKELFEKAPLTESMIRLALPSVAGQIILVLYNMADTFFIGLTRNDAKVTALTICMPAFMFLSAISNLFGIGGASAVSRALGGRDQERSRHISSFAFYGCLFSTFIYMIGTWIFSDSFVNFLGGTQAEVHAYAVQYLKITVVLGGFGTSMSALFSHFLRCEGLGFASGFGIALGGVLNMVLDPLLMFVILKPGHEVMGAAIATALANFLSLLFFAVIYLRRRHMRALSFSVKQFRFNRDMIRDVLSAGLPACAMTLFENVSYAVLDNILSQYGIFVQAGIGVAKKINMLAHSIVRGMSQGILPLIAFNYAAGNDKRMKKAASLSCLFSVCCACVCMLVSVIFSRPLISLFLQGDSPSSEYGVKFLRILCIGGPFSACAYACISLFQAVGMGNKAFLLAVMRKGVVDIPLMMVLDHFLSVYGAAWATPIADLLCCVTAILLTSAFFKAESRQKMNTACKYNAQAV